MPESITRAQTAREIAHSAARRIAQLADAMDDDELNLTLGSDIIATIRNDLTAIEASIAERRALAPAAVEAHWSERAQHGAAYIIGTSTDGNAVVGRTGVHMYIRDWERMMTKARLMPMLDRLRLSVDAFILWEPESFDRDGVSADRIICASCTELAGQHGAAVMAGASPKQMRAIVGHAKTCADCRDVTLVWVDTRARGAVVDVDLEAEFGYVLTLDECQDTFVLEGVAGPGVAVSLAA